MTAKADAMKWNDGNKPELSGYYLVTKLCFSSLLKGWERFVSTAIYERGVGWDIHIGEEIAAYIPMPKEFAPWDPVGLWREGNDPAESGVYIVSVTGPGDGGKKEIFSELDYFDESGWAIHHSKGSYSVVAYIPVPKHFQCDLPSPRALKTVRSSKWK